MAMARIVVSFGASEQWSLSGEEQAIRDQYQTLLGILGSTDGTFTKFFEFTGVQERADRRPEQFAVRVEDIKAVTFQEM